MEVSPPPSPPQLILYPLSHVPTSLTSCQDGGRGGEKEKGGGVKIIQNKS